MMESYGLGTLKQSVREIEPSRGRPASGLDQLKGEIESAGNPRWCDHRSRHLPGFVTRSWSKAGWRVPPTPSVNSGASPLAASSSWAGRYVAAGRSVPTTCFTTAGTTCGCRSQRRSDCPPESACSRHASTRSSLGSSSPTPPTVTTSSRSTTRPEPNARSTATPRPTSCCGVGIRPGHGGGGWHRSEKPHFLMDSPGSRSLQVFGSCQRSLRARAAVRSTSDPGSALPDRKNGRLSSYTRVAVSTGHARAGPVAP